MSPIKMPNADSCLVRLSTTAEAPRSQLIMRYLLGIWNFFHPVWFLSLYDGCIVPLISNSCSVA